MEKRRPFLVIALFYIFTWNYAAARSPFQLDPIRLSQRGEVQRFTRSLYSLDLIISDRDTAFFLQRPHGLSICSIDSVSSHEMTITFQIDSNFVDFQSYSFAVLDAAQQQKAQAAIDVRYADLPRINSISISSGRGSRADTLTLSTGKTTFAAMQLRGDGLFKTSEIVFDDPFIRVIDDPAWRIDNPPYELQVGLEIDGSGIELGHKSFRLKSKYAAEVFSTIFLCAAEPPVLLSPVRGFVADGQQQNFTVQGTGFAKGIRADIVPDDGFAHAVHVSAFEAKISLMIPLLEQSKSYRLVLTNPDGQADTSAYFSVRTTPLSSATAKAIEQKSIFRGKRAHILFTVDTRDGRQLNRQQSYEVNIEGDRFPVLRVISDSTCEAIIKLADSESATSLGQHLFTINEVDRAPQWRGLLKSRPAPKINYLSPFRIIHPTDSLALVIKGKNLQDALVLIDDPEVSFTIIENRGDLLRLLAVSGRHVTFGSYPLEIRIDDVAFSFENYRLEIKPWLDFRRYITFHVTRLGELADSTTFRGAAVQHAMQAQDVISVRINTRKIDEEYGLQKVHISAVLTDSANSIRAEAYDARMISAGNGTDIVTWRLRVRERIRAGDRFEITLKNPGDHNKITEFFVVEPHWSEAFHGSTSFILFKIPFGPSNEKTEILNSIGLGISYQPFIKKDFLEFDASFLVGNAKGEKSDLGIEVSFGLSAIFWRHLQVGLGANLTGSAFSKQFLFVGTRFKIPIPF